MTQHVYITGQRPQKHVLRPVGVGQMTMTLLEQGSKLLILITQHVYLDLFMSKVSAPRSTFCGQWVWRGQMMTTLLRPWSGTLSLRSTSLSPQPAEGSGSSTRELGPSLLPSRCQVLPLKSTHWPDILTFAIMNQLAKNLRCDPAEIEGWQSPQKGLRFAVETHYKSKRIYIRWFGTHAEYDNIDATTV